LNDPLTPNPDFKVKPLLDANISKAVWQRHGYNGILTWTYTCLIQRCHLKKNIR